MTLKKRNHYVEAKLDFNKIEVILKLCDTALRKSRGYLGSINGWRNVEWKL